jgi:hypothetical protein
VRKRYADARAERPAAEYAMGARTKAVFVCDLSGAQ